MREETANFTFSARDREILELMDSLGMNKNISKVLLFLSRNGESSSRKIEGAVDLRQSEVSIVTTEMKNKGWMSFRSIKRKGKGRPTNLFKLRQSLPRIIKKIEAEKMIEIEDMKKRIVYLKRLAK